MSTDAEHCCPYTEFYGDAAVRGGISEPSSDKNRLTDALPGD
jgi:hypothetical protein